MKIYPLLFLLMSCSVAFAQKDSTLLRKDTTAKQLELVTISSSRKNVEMKNGKLVYNVEKSAAAAGSTAFDLLRRTPGVKVDQDENLLLKGSAAANVMIDGKMNYLSAQQLASLLKGMTSDQISRIEMITAPSAQYDASGNSGIINIVTRKSSKPGYALNLSSGITLGHYVLNNQNITGNVRVKRFNFFGNLGHSYLRSYREENSRQVLDTKTGTAQMVDRIGFNPFRSQYYSYRLGTDVYLNKKQQIGFVYTGTKDDWIKDAVYTTYTRNKNEELLSARDSRVYSKEPYYNNAYNLNYKYSIDSIGKMLTADADYISYRNNSDGHLGSGTSLLNYHQPSFIDIRSLKTDLVWPIGKWNFKTGLKYSSVNIDNNFSYDSLQNNTLVQVPSLSDHFIYKEQIAAVYFSAAKQWENTTLDAGLRLEHTRSEGNAVNTASLNKRLYTDLFPSLSLTQQLGTNHKLDFSLSRRINRPGYRDLNPARYFIDQSSYYQGNPGLVAEKAWVVSGAYTLMDKYIASLSFNRADQFISSSINSDPVTGTLIQSVANFSHKDRFEAQVIVPIEISTFWSISTSATLSYTRYPLAQLQGFKNVDKMAIDLYAGQTFRLPGKTSLELLTRYTSADLNGVYMARYYFSMDGGIKKTLLKDKLDVKFAFADLFHTNRYWGYSLSNTANFSYKNIPDSRRFSFGLSYRLGGKLSGNKPRQTDEQKRL
eukprot:gene11087-12918_t